MKIKINRSIYIVSLLLQLVVLFILRVNRLDILETTMVMVFIQGLIIHLYNSFAYRQMKNKYHLTEHNSTIVNTLVILLLVISVLVFVNDYVQQRNVLSALGIILFALAIYDYTKLYYNANLLIWHSKIYNVNWKKLSENKNQSHSKNWLKHFYTTDNDLKQPITMLTQDYDDIIKSFN